MCPDSGILQSLDLQPNGSVIGALIDPFKGIWEFPKIGVPYFAGPYNKDPTIQGAILGSPIFGNSHIGVSGNPACWPRPRKDGEGHERQNRGSLLIQCPKKQTPKQLTVTSYTTLIATRVILSIVTPQ